MPWVIIIDGGTRTSTYREKESVQEVLIQFKQAYIAASWDEGHPYVPPVPDTAYWPTWYIPLASQSHRPRLIDTMSRYTSGIG